MIQTAVIQIPAFPVENAQGFVAPYGDCPLDNDRVGERVYMDILNRAQEYVHIMSPYLILEREMEKTYEQKDYEGLAP